MRLTAPIRSVASVYRIRLNRSAVVMTAAGMRCACMKSALAGCPPVAEGVIAEKN